MLFSGLYKIMVKKSYFRRSLGGRSPPFVMYVQGCGLQTREKLAVVMCNICKPCTSYCKSTFARLPWSFAPIQYELSIFSVWTLMYCVGNSHVVTFLLIAQQKIEGKYSIS